jgi:type IV protein arginine methyltransferase
MDESNFSYDKSRYTYTNDNLINEKGESVMMGWERPVMKKVSELITHNRGDILNIGFGMGIIDTYIQESNPNSHTIIESHPDVHNYIKELGWDKKENVNIINGTWQSQITKMGEFDGIYLDTWYDERVEYVKPLLDHHLKVGGVFSIWYNYGEFMDILKTLDERYYVSYVEIPNDNLIPDAKTQFENGGFYIDPNRTNIIIPVVKKLN